MVKKKRIGDLMIQQGLITQEQLEIALSQQKVIGKKLGRILVEMGMINELQLFKVLEIHFGIPYVDLNKTRIDPKVPKLISENLARMHNLLPVRLEKGRLTITMSDPLDIIAKDDVRFATGMEVDVVVSAESDIKRAIDRYYDNIEETAKATREFIDQQVDKQVVEEEEVSEDVANAPMVRLVNSIISQAIRNKASDIHIEPFEQSVRIRFRIDGALQEIMSVPINAHGAIVTRIKIMGKMKISERRAPQDGRIEMLIDGVEIDMRISVLPTVYGEKVVIRLLDRNNIILDLKQLGFSDRNMARLKKILSVPEGILLATGPTGSGKTTTLYTLLREFNKIDTNIITIEDPVEYKLNGINQVQVNNKANLTFATGLRSILRQDPDIVMIGEMRDTETAQIAIRAAITGHVVLSTLHTNDTASTLTRLVDMGVPNYLVSTATVGIIAQRLVKRICPKCAVSYEAGRDEKHLLAIDDSKMQLLWKGTGCNACNDTGYSGRVAVHEILIVDKQIRNLMYENAKIEEIRSCAIENGMLTLRDSCIEQVLNGVTTIDELLRVTYNINQE